MKNLLLIMSLSALVLIFIACGGKKESGTTSSTTTSPANLSTTQATTMSTTLPDIVDADEDEIFDNKDNCLNVFNPRQEDSDGDCIGDACDEFPDVYDSAQPDSDNDGFGNVCDNCRVYYNPDQKDTDSLPPYEVLDPLLQMFVEQEMTPKEIFVSKWFEDNGGLGKGKVDSGQVNMMYRLYRTSEYKRQQMAPGAKLQKRSFGMGRRMPIAMKLTSI